MSRCRTWIDGHVGLRSRERVQRVARLLVLAAAGCGQGGANSEVSLGAAQASIDLSTCARTECPPPAVDRPFIESPADECQPVELAPLTARWREHFNRCADDSSDCLNLEAGPLLPADCEQIGPCVIAQFEIAVAPDGSLWAAGATASMPTADASSAPAAAAGVWLAHHARDGRRLSGAMIDFELPLPPYRVTYDAQVEVDGRGHAFVVTTKASAPGENAAFEEAAQVQTETRLREYAPDGQQLGPAIAVLGARSREGEAALRPWLRAAGDASIAIAQPQWGGGGIAILDSASRVPRWVQPRKGRLGFTNMVSDTRGRISLLTHSPNGQASGRIEHYDEQGRLEWERTCDIRSAGERSALDLGVDGTGDLLLLGVQSATGQIELQKISADGAPIWFTRIGFSSYQNIYFDASVRLVADARDTLFIPGLDVYTEMGAAGFVHELSADGAWCGTHAWREATPFITRLAIGQAGELCFAALGSYGCFSELEGSNP